MQIVGDLIAKKTLVRLFTLALFVAALVAFRHLAILLVFFVVFERTLGTASDWLAERTKIPRKAALLGLALLFLGALGSAIAFGVLRAIHSYVAIRGSIPERVAAFRHTPLFEKLHERVHGMEGLLEKAQHYSNHAVGFVATFGHVLLYLVIGFILAIVFLLERDELVDFAKSVPPASLPGTLLRWFRYVADAIGITLQFQVVVAAFNAVLTFPVLLLVGIHHATAYMFMIFASGLVPVAGNFVAGAILTVLAYHAKGYLGVALFVVLTFVLHKIESYYLSPRLAQKHVRLPGFVMIVSLIAWEHLLGFAGLFISFPFLFVAAKIRSEFKQADADQRPGLALTDEQSV